ncbi:MAG: acyl-CoA dehydrogenase family protein [Vicinamibacterales bacterium]|nr:acyl-CoA dehydrogenase family protein [Vicinamibacterales bacterium]
MDFELNETQVMFRDMVREFVTREVKPIALEYDQKPKAEDCAPLDVYRRSLAQGYHQMVVPTDMGGMGLDAVSTIVILEEMAAADAGYAVTWHVNNVSLTMLLNLGSFAEAETFIGQIMAGEGGVASLSTTEPDGGVTSALLIDPAKFVFKTRAVPDGDHWVINGAKSFCSNAGLPFSRWILAFCRVNDKTGWASTMPFVIPPDVPGLTIGAEEDKMGHRLSSTRSLIFDNVRVPKANAIGSGGRAMSGGKRRTPYDHDTAIAAIAVGCARAAYEEAVAWAKTREVLGQPLIRHQLIQAKIADMYIGLEAARSFMYRTAAYSDTHDQMDVRLSRAVKVFASETANRVTSDALQVLGGMGYCKGSVTEKCFRDQRVTPIYEGTNEAQRISIAQLIESTF